jgi:hypothetical protein
VFLGAQVNGERAGPSQAPLHSAPLGALRTTPTWPSPPPASAESAALRSPTTPSCGVFSPHSAALASISTASPGWLDFELNPNAAAFRFSQSTGSSALSAELNPKDVALSAPPADPSYTKTESGRRCADWRFAGAGQRKHSATATGLQLPDEADVARPWDTPTARRVEPACGGGSGAVAGEIHSEAPRLSAQQVERLRSEAFAAGVAEGESLGFAQGEARGRAQAPADGELRATLLQAEADTCRAIASSRGAAEAEAASQLTSLRKETESRAGTLSSVISDLVRRSPSATLACPMCAQCCSRRRCLVCGPFYHSGLASVRNALSHALSHPDSIRSLVCSGLWQTLQRPAAGSARSFGTPRSG